METAYSGYPRLTEKPDKYSERPLLRFERSEWKMPLLFMLSLGLFGLQFYPAILFVIIILIKEFKRNRYNFIIELTILFGAYGMYDYSTLPLKFSDVALVLSIVLAFLYRKDSAEKKTLLVLVAYALSLIIIATYSLESMSVQFVSMRYYLLFIYFIVPVACFAGREFDMQVMFRQIIMFCLIMCAFYLIDSVILGCNFLVPATFSWGDPLSTFYKPRFNFFHIQDRKFPLGIYIVVLCIYPISRFYRLSWRQWLILIGGVAVAKTFILISGFTIAYIFFQGKIKVLLKYCVILVVGAVSLYFIDGWLPKVEKLNNTESTLRIKSSVDQILALSKAVDPEDIAKFASGRMAQIIPKVELVYKEHKQWTGLGFLHAEHTKINRYFIHNEYYENEAARDELAFGVENVQVQVFLTIGYVGTIAMTVFLLLLWLIVHKMRYSSFFGCTLLLCWWGGISGLTNLTSFLGLGLVALSYGCVILANRDASRIRRK